MKDKLLKSLIVAMFVIVGAFSSAQAEMQCDMKMPKEKETKNSKCDMNTTKSTPKMKEKCIPKTKEKCVDGKCPTQDSAKK